MPREPTATRKGVFHLWSRDRRASRKSKPTIQPLERGDEDQKGSSPALNGSTSDALKMVSANDRPPSIPSRFSTATSNSAARAALQKNKSSACQHVAALSLRVGTRDRRGRLVGIEALRTDYSCAVQTVGPLYVTQMIIARAWRSWCGNLSSNVKSVTVPRNCAVTGTARHRCISLRSGDRSGTSHFGSTT